ncbi:MAG: nucleotidyltransferase family protein [Oscillospiraceae bacterium]|nr:nucleotidyltransferase family protein [Oscillospiraceae bacterium]
MRCVGIVCEYNPFHLGHLYHMEESRKLCGDALIVCVMSGDFVQRGEAALFTKFARAEAACRSGADLVVELPLPWCLSSAERFASGAVALLASLGCDTLSFGSECASKDALARLAAADAEEKTREAIRRRMKEGGTLSWAEARQQVLRERFGEDAELLSRPNDILAVEYLKAAARFAPDMQALCIPRRGAEHDVRAKTGFRSAMDLRESLERGEQISAAIPASAWEVFERELAVGRTRDVHRLELALRSRLLQLRETDFDALPDASDGAGRRLYRMLCSGEALETCVREASTRRYSRARMRRMLLCAALGISAECTREAPPYARLLACSAGGRAWLAQNADRFPIPLITKPAALREQGGRAEAIFKLGASAHELYKLQFVTNDDKTLGTDWRTGPFIG